MKWYLYGLARQLPHQLPPGVEGQEVGAVEQAGCVVLLSPWPGERAPLPDEDQVWAHERVVEAIMQHTAVLPVRFGTIADEAAWRTFVAEHSDVIGQRLQQVAGMVEVSLKLLDLNADPGQRAAPRRPGALPDRAGATYLLQRQQAARHEQERAARARELVAAVEAPLAPLIAQRCHVLTPGERVLAALTHLIPQQALSAWVERVQALQGAHDGIDLLASGPWPPYHFAEVTSGGRQRQSDPGTALFP